MESLKLICPWKVALFRAYIFQSTSSMKEILCLENLKESQLPYSTIPGKSTTPELRHGNVLHTDTDMQTLKHLLHIQLFEMYLLFTVLVSQFQYFWHILFLREVFIIKYSMNVKNSKCRCNFGTCKNKV